MTTVTRAAYEAAVEAGQKEARSYWISSPDRRAAAAIIDAALSSLGITVERTAEEKAGLTVRDPDPAPPAVVRITRERYEAGVQKALSGGWGHNLLDQVLAAAGIEVEPERTPEEMLAEIEERLANFLIDARALTDLSPGDPPVTLDEALTVITSHFPEVRRDGR